MPQIVGNNVTFNEQLFGTYLAVAVHVCELSWHKILFSNLN